MIGPMRMRNGGSVDIFCMGSMVIVLSEVTAINQISTQTSNPAAQGRFPGGII